MKFLRAEDQVHVRQTVNQFLSAALGHAPRKPSMTSGRLRRISAADILHFVQRLLLREIPHAARVQQDDIGGGFPGGEVIALGDELGGDGFAVALVHLASVGLDVNTRHNPEQLNSLSHGQPVEKQERSLHQVVRTARKWQVIR